VGNDVGAEVQGVLVNRGLEGVVYNEDYASSLQGISDGPDIEALQGGVGGSL